MKSRRPYLIRALYDWIVDSDSTPFILVKANSDAVIVPRDYVKDGQITLNIAPTAVRDLLIDDGLMTFAGRFAGQSVDVCIPLSSIGAIYARETGDGMLFDTDEAPGAAALSEQETAVRDVDLSPIEDRPAASLAYDSVAQGSTDTGKAGLEGVAERPAERASHLKVVK
ncbi:MAG: ClpXP protease specificity-enhancing factor [Pseudomonadales bacterium]